MTNLGGMIIGRDGNCPKCNEPTWIVKDSQTEVGEEVYIKLHTFCTKCQIMVKSCETRAFADKLGRIKVDI